MYRLGQAIEEQVAVGKIGQRVVQCLVLEDSLEPLALADVPDHGDDLRSSGACDRAEGDVGRELTAVLALELEIVLGGAHRSRTGVGVVVAAVLLVDRPKTSWHEQLYP